MRLYLSSLACVAAVAGLAGCGSDGPGTSAPAASPSSTSSAPSTSAPTSTPSAAAAPDGQTITIKGNDALVWGDGPYGVVLAHGRSYDAASWKAQAPQIAAQGATVIAVESIEPQAILDAVEKLQGDGITKVALMGGSAGADAILQLASREPDLADQLVLLSPNRVISGLGSQPKLFIASADEPNVEVSRELASSSPGDDNDVEIVPGRAHAQAILKKDADGSVLALVLDRLEQ